MKTRRQVEQRLSESQDDSEIEVLKWVLKAPDCALCQSPNKVELEMKIHRGEVTAVFLEQKYGWLPGSVNVHIADHEDYDPVKAGLIEAMRQDTINTLNLAENTAQKIADWLTELEAQRSPEYIDTDFIADATRLTGQLGGYLKLAGALKKEIGTDSQLLLAQRQLDEVMYILVDTLKAQPELLDQIEFRVGALKAPVIDANYEVVELMGKYKHIDEWIEVEEVVDEAIIDMIPKSARQKWRKRTKHITTKPIPKTEFPKLATLMTEDGLEFVLTDEGYEWYHGEYRVTTTAICEVWGLTSHQWRRFLRWCYKHWPAC